MLAKGYRNSGNLNLGNNIKQPVFFFFLVQMNITQKKKKKKKKDYSWINSED